MRSLSLLNRLESRIQTVVGTLLIVTALIVTTAWKYQALWAIQLASSAAPMQFNTALGFLMLGIGILVSFRASPWIPCLLAASAATLGGLSLLQTLLNAEFGIDQFFVRSLSLSTVTHAGRMAPNTSVCFVLSGAALVILSLRSRFAWSDFAASTLAGLAGGIATISLFGYLIHLPGIYSWSDFAGMAIHTCCGFIVASGFFLVSTLVHSLSEKDELPAWGPIAIGITGLAVSIIFWRAIGANEAIHIRNALQEKAEGISSTIALGTLERNEAIQRIAKRWGAHPKNFPRIWDTDAENFFLDFPGFRSITVWLNGQIVQQAYSTRFGPRQNTGRFSQETNLAARRAESTGQLTLAQESHNLVIIAPVPSKTRPAGVVIVINDIRLMFEELLSGRPADSLLTVWDSKEELFRRTGSEPLASEWEAQAPLDLGNGIHWKLKLSPPQHYIDNLKTMMEWYILVFGGLVTLLVCAAYGYARRARQNATKAAAATRKLHDREERLAFSLASAQAGSWDWSITENTISWDAAMFTLFGVSAETFTPNYDRFLEMVHPDDKEPTDRKVRESIEKDQDFEAEYRVIWPDHSIHYILARGKSYQDSEGKPNRMLGICWDVTQRKRDELARLKAEQKFRVAMETAPDAVLLIDSNGKIISVNAQGEKLFGYSGEEMLGQDTEMLIPKDLRAKHVLQRNHYIASPEPRSMARGRDLYGLTKAGKLVPVEISLSPGRAENESFVMAVVRDLTERKKAEEKIRATLAEKEVLLREIHHRVKNNLNVVSSLLGLQAQSIDDPKLSEAFRESRNRVVSMALVHEKLYQSHNLAEIDFGQYVNTFIPSLVHSYGFNRNEIVTIVNIDDVKFDIDTAIPCSLIINELVSNSLKYAFKETHRGNITIGVHPRSSLNGFAYELTVCDDGIGMPKGFNIDRSASLGLKLVKTLTRQMDGDLEIDTTKGTKFTIHFGKTMGHALGHLERAAHVN